eukprot:2239669-Ditylum_brightwellii.AAC.1
MSKKILQLPPECQLGMKLLACLGSKCDKSTLRLLVMDQKYLQKERFVKKRKQDADNINNEFSIFDPAIDEGLLKEERSSYMFAHDQIQHGAYSLMLENERARLHHQIGHSILGKMSDDRVSDLLFIAVDQLNRGEIFMKEEHGRMKLAKLNLKAGEKAMSLATFLSSASYLEQGISLLCDDHWEKYYDLSLRLY